MVLTENPFYLLGASTRDGRHRIVELAEERSLSLDQALCARWSAELLNPRQRLQSEVAWLPGVSPQRALTLAAAAATGAPGERLPSPLAQVNLLVTALATPGRDGPAELGARLVEIAAAWEQVEPEQVRVLINEDRAAAGFALIEDSRDVARALQGRMDAVRSAMAQVLRGISEEARVAALTAALERGTESGSVPGPELLHTLVDALAVDLQGALDRERAAVEAAIAQVRASATAPGQVAILAMDLAALATALRRWDGYAQPLQLSAKSRGQDHEASTELARSVRNLGVELHNERQRYEAAQELTELLGEVFAEVPRIAELVAEDRRQLEALRAEREAAEERRAIVAEMQPISSAPPLRTINGIGTMVFGRRNVHPPTGTYVATLYFVLFFIPIIPLRCYRVRDGEGGGWQFLGRVPFARREKLHAWGLAAAVALWMLVSSIGGASRGAPDGEYSHESPCGEPICGSSDAAPAPVSFAGRNRGARDRLGRWIDAERQRIHGLERNLATTTELIRGLKDELDRQKRRVDSYDALARDGVLPADVYDAYDHDFRRYNRLVDEFNAVLEPYQADRARYERALAAVNDSIDRYNSMR